MRRVTLDHLLSFADAQRVCYVLDKLALHGFRESAFTASLALETVASFTSIPPALADRFLFRHIHPHVPEGKTLIQLLDPWRAAGP
jgi:hypothetical protein